MEIREEHRDDAASIAELHHEAFGDNGAVVATLVEELRATVNSGSGVSLVGEQDGAVAGHVMFSRGLLDAPTRPVAVQILSPVGVRPASQGQGIGTALITQGLEMLSQRGVPAVFLEGDPRYYARFGFVAAKPLGFRKPSGRIPDAGFQVRTLPAYESWMTGALVYPDPFWRHPALGLR